jgi:adenylylsulfate kinase-like enzyme
MSTNKGKFLWITGLSGAGKTTLGEALKNSAHNFQHFNVDIWVFGGNPITESHLVPTPDMMKSQDPVVKAAFDQMIAQGFQALGKGEAVDFSVWKQFFDLLIPKLQQFRHELPANANLVVTFSVYLQSIRQYLRQELGEDLQFVILNPSVEDVAMRKVNHLQNTAKARNQTLSQFLRSITPNAPADAPELPEETIVEIFKGQTRASAAGFEGKQENEVCSIELGDLSVDQLLTEVLQFLGL